MPTSIYQYRNSPGHIKFHVQGRTYQFKALSFGLSTAPMEPTVVAKELKLMAILKGIIIHQYLDDWLVKATSHQVCLQHKSKLEPKPGLRPCRLPVRPHGRSGPTYTGPLAEPSGQILEILSLPVCPVHQFMSDRFTNSHRKASLPRSTS